jgi:hypothetical protein
MLPRKLFLMLHWQENSIAGSISQFIVAWILKGCEGCEGSEAFFWPYFKKNLKTIFDVSIQAEARISEGMYQIYHHKGFCRKSCIECIVKTPFSNLSQLRVTVTTPSFY